METTKSGQAIHYSWRDTLLLMAAWSAVLALSLGFNLDQQKAALKAEMLSEAKAFHATDMAYRAWIIGHGGVYVPATAQTPPSPFLAQVPERDVTTPSGKTLTLLNSSYAMREVHDILASQFGETIHAHIASLKPINPVNTADAWETQALQQLQKGNAEVSESPVLIKGKPFLRYMRPMVMEDSCLKCHASYGLKRGDVHGGISVAIPIHESSSETGALWAGHGLIWGLGMLGLFVGGKRQRLALQAVVRSEEEVKLLTNAIAHAIFGQDLEGRCTFANEACVKMLGYERESQLLGQNMHALIHYQRADHTPCRAADCPILDTGLRGSSIHVDTEVFWRKDGSQFPVDYWAYPIVKNGERLGSVVTFIDITEQQRISQALSHSQTVLDSIVENVPAMIFLKEAKELRFELFNRAGEQLLGFSRNDLLGKNDYDFFPQEQADFFTQSDRSVLESHKVKEIEEETITTADGSQKWLRTFKTGLYDGQGQPTHLLGISVDITASRQAQRVLAKSEQALAKAQRIAHIGSWELDLVSNTLHWSDEIFRIFELDRGSFTPSYAAFLEAIHPEDREAVDKAYTESLKTRRPYDIEHRLLMRDGSIKYVREQCETVFDPEGKPLRSTGTVQDISQRKRVEIALRRSKEQYDDLVNRIPVGIYLYHFFSDGGDRFDYVSPQFCLLLGVQEAEVLQDPRTAFSAAHPDDLESLLHANTEAFKGQQPFHWEGRFIVRGEVRWIKLESEPTPLPNGESLWNGVVSDITQRRQAEASLTHAHRALNALSTVNHELVHATDEVALMKAICRAIVEQKHYRMAWVGYLQHDEAKSIKLIASAGDEQGILEKVHPSWAEEEIGLCPIAVHTGQSQVSSDIAHDPQYQPWKKLLLEQGCASSIALPMKASGQVFGIMHVYADETGAFTEQEVALLEEMSEDLAFGVSALRIRQERDQALQENAEHLGQMHETLHQTVIAISKAVEVRDPYTAGHQRRVADLACAIAQHMGLNEARIEGIRMGGTIHDIGKIQVPAEILTKPSRLSEVEFQLIREHPTVGYDILRNISFPWPVAEIAHQHHERLDGSGYPQGLKGDEICFEARIVMVADVVEAMSSHRPYRPSLGIEVALEEIKTHRGKYYDPEVVDACLALFEEGFELT